MIPKEALKNPNTTSPKYNPNSRSAFHSDSPGHNTDDCWALKNKVQDLIDAKEIEFEAPERPNVVTAPMTKHGVNAVVEDLFVASVDDIVTRLMIVNKNLLLVGLFPGCSEGCHLCSVSPTGCPSLKSGIQNLMRSEERRVGKECRSRWSPYH